MYAPALREYERITGFHETNPNVLWDYVLSRLEVSRSEVSLT
jgi:hypothetical protein